MLKKLPIVLADAIIALDPNAEWVLRGEPTSEAEFISSFEALNEAAEAITFDAGIVKKAEMEAAEIANAPLVAWKVLMEATDKDMPRWLENHIEHSHGGVADNDYQQAAYDEKKKLRGQKP